MAEYLECKIKSVLIIEDSDTTRELLKTGLEAEGCDVYDASTGFLALKELQVRLYDLIITDINMPDLTGLEVIKLARSSPMHRNTPIIVLSTDNRKRDRERALALGANMYVTKPFEPDKFLQTCLERLNENKSDDPGEK